MMSSWRKDRSISNCYAVMGHMWNTRMLGGGVGFDLVMGLQDQEQRQGITACICGYVVLALSELSMELVMCLVQLCGGGIYGGVQLFLWGIEAWRYVERDCVCAYGVYWG